MFEAEDALEDDGHGSSVAIRLRVSRSGQRLVFDFRDSDAQTDSSLNAVRAVTIAAVYYALKLLGGARLPANEGVLRQLDILTSPGTVCDASYPAAVSAGNVETSQRVPPEEAEEVHEAHEALEAALEARRLQRCRRAA